MQDYLYFLPYVLYKRPKLYIDSTLPPIIVQKAADFALAQFTFYTQNSYAKALLCHIIEQQSNHRFCNLYQQLITLGPLQQLSRLFYSITLNHQQSEEMALQLYSPVVFSLCNYTLQPQSMYSLQTLVYRHIKQFAILYTEKFSQ